MKKVSLIVLSRTNSEGIYNMNLNCFLTFIESAICANLNFEIILVESANASVYNYDIPQLKTITPDSDFNFHKFLNIGMSHASGDYYVLSNNDVVYTKTWLQEIFKVATLEPQLMSFSPYDKKSNKLAPNLIKENKFVIGYEIQKHLTGWCIVMHKNVLKKIKKLDERFDFYYADYDYAMQLQKYNIRHALVTNAEVHHLEKVSDGKNETIDYERLPKNTPKYLIEQNWTWVLKDVKMVEGIITFHNKWGRRQTIKIKLDIIKKINKMRLGFLNVFILTSK